MEVSHHRSIRHVGGQHNCISITPKLNVNTEGRTVSGILLFLDFQDKLGKVLWTSTLNKLIRIVIQPSVSCKL